MNIKTLYQNVGLLFAGLMLILGMVGILSADPRGNPRLVRGLFFPGVLLAFVVGAASINRNSDAKLGGLLIGGLLLMQVWWDPESPDKDTLDRKGPV